LTLAPERKRGSTVRWCATSGAPRQGR